MQMQYMELIEDKTNLGMTFWDAGSNINLVRSDFVERLGSVGRPCVQNIQVSGHPMEPWQTKAHWVTMVSKASEEFLILAFEVEKITTAVDRVDVTPILDLFPGLTYEEVYRPMGEVDLLVGIQEASLHPTVSERSVIDNLRLLDSKFGTGKLLDG